MLKILNQKQVKTVVHSIVPKTSYYQVNFTHEKDDLRVQGSSGIDDWRGIYIGGIFMVFFITFGIPDAGDFDDGFSSSNEVTESFAPLFASNDENTYLEIIQQINEDKEAFENSTSTPPAGAELVNSEISIDSNIDTANRIFKMNLNINYNDKSNDTTVDWTRSVEFLFDLEIDYNQSIVRNMLYEAKIEIEYEDASRLFFQSLSIGTSSNDGGFLDNIREQVSLTPAILFVLPSMIFIITIRKAKRK
ncbi:MAG: hypothetical protein D6732_02490 [Methanobacteriota archaeon]|nr:MAG: hypothetical protein D6732_02490 [Euryarchaeota archaeon]